VSIEQPVRENKVLVDCVNRTSSQSGCVEDGWVTSRGSVGADPGGTGVSAVAAPTVRLARLLSAQPRSAAVALGGTVRSAGAAPGGEARSWWAPLARAGGEAYNKATGSGEVRGGGEWSSDSMGLQWGTKEKTRK
jgi:hypothetical protein